MTATTAALAGLLMVVASPLVALDVRGFLADHCLRCHGDGTQKGDVRLDTLPFDAGDPQVAERWAEVVRQLTSGAMPPGKEPRPSSSAATAVVEQVTAVIRAGEARRLARREPVSFHRLTRSEYANTIRDLLGVTVMVEDPAGLPPDAAWHGIERIGARQDWSPTHLEKYLALAESAVREALPDRPPAWWQRRWEWHDLRGGERALALAKRQGIAERVRLEVWPGSDFYGGPPGNFGIPLPTAGEYRFRVRLSGMKPPQGRGPRLRIEAPGLGRVLHDGEVVTREDQPLTVEFTAHLPGALDLRFTCEAPGPSNLPRSGRGDHSRLFTTIAESHRGRHPWQIKLTDEAGVPLLAFLIVDWLEIEGPLAAHVPTLAAERYRPLPDAGRDDVVASLRRFVTAAFRRPVPEHEHARFIAVLDGGLARGESPLSSLRTALVAVLCSKDVLHLVEGAPGQSGLSPWEVASRLSYLLWSTTPDERLRALAADGTLVHPAVLRGEVRRLLADDRSRRFTREFTSQWLRLGEVGRFPPDQQLYGDYDPYLERSMVAEAQEFVAAVLRGERALGDLIHSDWAMLNGRLAEHYGIAGVEGDAFRRVELSPQHHRGGLLTQAGVLSLTSDGQRHRPVHRGVWLLETILDRPPPPPPADVPAIEPTPAGQRKTSIRDKLAAHRSDAACAGCHQRIDPLGLAFDHYDAIGRWRARERASDGSGEDPLVDASGALPDGRRFADAEGFKRLLLADLDQVATALTRKLAAYAIRRPVTIDDHAAIAAIVERSRQRGHTLRALVEELLSSELFVRR